METNNSNTAPRGYFYGYYKRTIEARDKGLKLVLGGTGLGKTSAIVDIVTDATEDPEAVGNRKFIYIANRVQLLNEMQQHFEERGLGKICVHQKNNHETLVSAETDIEGFFANNLIRKYANHLEKKGRSRITVQQVRRAWGFIMREYEFAKKGSGRDAYTEEKIEDCTRLVFRFFQDILSEAYKRSVDPDITRYTKEGFTQNDFGSLIALPETKALFPYIEYKYNPEKKILLITLQKAFFGVFDGVRIVDLMGFDNRRAPGDGNRIIFMDEFDFLENDLTTLICKDIDIFNPFKFVEVFYTKMNRDKLPEKIYPGKADVRLRIEKILKIIEQVKNEYGIPYPDINHYICRNENAVLKGKSIFQTSHSIVDIPVYLDTATRTNSFDLCTGKKLSAFTLFNHVKLVTGMIIELFKTLEFQDPAIARELMEQCFEVSDVYKEALGKIRQRPSGKKTYNGGEDPGEVRPPTDYDRLHHDGFVLYEIKDLGWETDRDEVAFRSYAMYTTPEAFLLHLSKNNLVFGLSATAEIRRLVRNFDTRWLRDELDKDYIEVTGEDITDIRSANDRKQRNRGNDIHLVRATELSPTNHVHIGYEDFIDSIAREDALDEDDNPVFDSNFGGYKNRRLNLFFSTLFRIIEAGACSGSDTHLLFYNSYRQVKYIFKEYPDKAVNLFRAVKSGKSIKRFEYYELEFQGVRFLVAFYDARKGREIASDKKVENIFHELFWEGKPVIVVTTYPSAGNGINLQYYSTSARKENKGKPDRDFTHIHLLDKPYYFFGKLDDNEKDPLAESSVIKMNIYYLAKLFSGKTISMAQFRGRLKNIRGVDLFNRDYLETSDGVLNQLAVFVQAIGRVERVWNKMDDQTIHLSDEAARIFHVFYTDPEYKELRNRVVDYFSGNMTKVFELVAADAKRVRIEIERVKQADVGLADRKCREEIRRHLDKISLLRQGKGNYKAVRQEWADLREFALRHDFAEKKLRDNYGVFSTPHFNKGRITINRVTKEIVPPGQWGAWDGYWSWDLDDVYSCIRDNDTIRNYFTSHGYEMSFGNHGVFFTPYFYQAVLKGAVGEKAVTALLEKEFLALGEDEIPDSLFEVADTKISGHPWYIDCKNYSEGTMQIFGLDEDDPAWHPKLNSEYFRERARQKLLDIRRHHSNETAACKLIYINLISSADRDIVYYDENVDRFTGDPKESPIIVVPGVLDRVKNKTETSGHFEQFIYYIKEVAGR